MAWVTLSLLDRLLPHPDPASRDASLNELKISLRRDLEYLLNTPKSVRNEIEEYPGLRGSVLDFGLVEFVGIDIADPGAQTRIAVALEETIRAFEPRLMNVSVVPLFGENSPDRSRGTAANPLQLSFRVRADFHYYPARERVHFNAVLESGTGHVTTTEISDDA
jgi:type VI secretion system protein ImpF